VSDGDDGFEGSVSGLNREDCGDGVRGPGADLRGEQEAEVGGLAVSCLSGCFSKIPVVV
jgi:hypothetical protein